MPLEITIDPNIVFILLVLGLLTILVEIIDLALGFIGVFGVIVLTAGIYGLLNLDINELGLLLILLASFLFVLEHRSRVRIVFTLLGLIVFIVGVLVLFHPTKSPPLSVPLVVLTSSIMAAIFYWVSITFGQHHVPVAMGTDTLVGRQGVARSDLNPRGAVFVAGELWSAECVDVTHLKAGEAVEVTGVDGIRLLVRRIETTDS